MNRLLFGLLMLVVLLAPLPLGSNREWSWTLCAFLVSVISLAWVTASAFQPQRINTRLSPVVTLMFLAACGWALLQIASWTPVSWHHPLWAMSGQTLGQTAGQLLGDSPALPLIGSITLSADDTLTALMRLVSYALVFFLAFQFTRSRERAWLAIRLLAIAGLAYAAYGLYNYWAGTGKLFWFTDDTFTQNVRGTFVNRNSYATYARLVLLCAMAWLYQATVVPRSNQLYNMSMDRRVQIEQFILRAWLPLAVILLISTSLVLTHSRGGFISTAIGGAALLGALNYRQQYTSGRSKAVILATIAAAIFVFVTTSEVLLKRMDDIEVEDSGRLVTYELTAQPLRDGDFRGLGYGTYASGFRLYRDERVKGYNDKAHNTWLENIFELGLPAAMLLFSSIGWLAVICANGIRTRARDWVYPATGLAATVLVGVHSLVDFSLQIPGVAITYACIMGIAVAQSYSSRHGEP